MSMPDDLVAALDAEAERRGATRSALLQAAARREIGLPRREPEAIVAELDELSAAWQGPVDAAAIVRAERLRDE